MQEAQPINRIPEASHTQAMTTLNAERLELLVSRQQIQNLRNALKRGQTLKDITTEANQRQASTIDKLWELISYWGADPDELPDDLRELKENHKRPDTGTDPDKSDGGEGERGETLTREDMKTIMPDSAGNVKDETGQ